MTTAGYAVWLYGSHARGVPDGQSDIDVLVAADRSRSTDEILQELPVSMKFASVSLYTWDELSAMASYGSLFLQHLKLEAYPLYESPSRRGKLRELLEGLRDYEFANRDIRGFKTVLDDVEEALDNEEEEVASPRFSGH